jgi:hypothetical protein
MKKLIVFLVVVFLTSCSLTRYGTYSNYVNEKSFNKMVPPIVLIGKDTSGGTVFIDSKRKVVSFNHKSDLSRQIGLTHHVVDTIVK